MKRSTATYGQIDKVLQSLGYTCRLDKDEPPARIYLHEDAQSVIMLPAYPKRNRAFEHHLVLVRTQLDGFGLLEASEFDAKLQKAS